MFGKMYLWLAGMRPSGLRVPLLSCLILAVTAGSASALDEATIERELRFAGELNKLGLSDFAQRVVDQLVAEQPSLKPRMRVVEVGALAGRRKFDEAVALANQLDLSDAAVQSATLDLANTLFSYGRTQQARAMWDRFFAAYGKKKPETPEQVEQYVEASYRLSQMLAAEKQLAPAIAALQRGINAGPEIGFQRTLAAEAGLLYTEYARTLTGEKKGKALAKAEELTSFIFFKGDYDLLYGKGVSGFFFP